ncbi:DUF3422 domain-containing protein [Halovulum dunhuangense]|uniref:DUF3422 domain-containing protein n=1 Tax=Halovulum dunhuangense TaxID=1505036 RepID=A0A849KWG6_9RHOB|nr:DUF3422 domain-containing protein [Halovulum dunhuangense]NNU79585.1 DUF3422 domain-containing protein [Halovulum dunhuangense]
MATKPLDDYPDRYSLSNELHARPFPELSAPCRAAYIAIKQPQNAAERDRTQDLEHLKMLLDRYGAPHPAPGANHYSSKLGRGFLKWEQHTEFVTYTIFAEGVADVPFDGSVYTMFSDDWLAAAPGKVLTSCLVRVERVADQTAAGARVDEAFSKWFVPESLAVSSVIDGAAVIGSDFRIDENGHVRLAVLATDGTGQRRLGRIVQRLLEIETYKSMAMLALPQARMVAGRVATLDRELAAIVGQMAASSGEDQATLDRLLKISAEVELLSSSTAFRFGAAGAYEAIVTQRIEVLREMRLRSRQTFAEFMTRRFDPAMRTCRSAQARLTELSQRAERASNLLRTRVDVAAGAQNVEVLRRMDERAALQLRLQETVEGLSVVAISYYAVNLAANLLKPLGDEMGLSEGWLYAGLTVPVVALVWLMVRRVRQRIARREAAAARDGH